MKNSKNQFKVNEQALINDILTNGKQERTWYDLAIQHGIVPNSSKRENQALTKAANDVWRRYNKLQGNIDLTPRPEIVPLQNFFLPFLTADFLTNSSSALSLFTS